MTEEQAQRWEEIKRGFARVQLMGGAEDDPVTRVTGGLSALGAELGHIRDAVTRAAKEAALASASRKAAPPPLPVKQEAPPPAQLDPKLVELLQTRIDQLGRAMVELAKVAAAPKPPALPPAAPSAPPPAIQLDLSPYLDRLDEVLRTLAERPAELPAEALQRAAAAQPAGPAGATPTPAHYDRQVELVQRALAPLARMARRSLREQGGGAIRSMEVWRHVNEALQLLQTIPPAPDDAP